MDVEAVRDIMPNVAQRGGNTRKWEAVQVHAHSEEDLPDQVTRMGEPKVQFLATNLGRIGPNDDVLELFAGTGLSTAVTARCMPHSLTSIDLAYDREAGPWWYVPEVNFRRIVKGLGIKRHTTPTFVPADARSVPLPDRSVDVVVAPDSPRTALYRTEQIPGSELFAGQESDLSYAEQRDIFMGACREAFRVLRSRGRFVGTGPISWVRDLAQLIAEGGDFGGTIQIIGDPSLGEDVLPLTDPKVGFRSKDMTDPIVYFSCTKAATDPASS